MIHNLIIIGINTSLIGIILSAVVSLLNKSYKAGGVILLLSNIAGFIATLLYFIFIGNNEILIFKTSSLLGLKLSLTFLSSIFLLLVYGISSLVNIYSFKYLNRYKSVYNTYAVQSLTAIFIFGMAGVLLSSNAIGFLVFWEIMSITSFFLVMSDKKDESIKAAFIYFIMTHLGASAILGGFMMLGNGTLSFNLTDISVYANSLSPVLKNLSFILFFIGFGSKAGLIPLHIWLPEAHPQAPTNISAMMSGLMLKIAIYGFLLIMFSYSNLPIWIAVIVIVLGLLSAFFGALHAVVGNDIKKIFAYSSIENMGMIFSFLGIALLILSQKPDSTSLSIAIFLVACAIFHSINHAIFKTGLFLSSGVIINKTHSKNLEKMGGLANLMPIFSVIFFVIIFASTALPPFGIFYGEWGFVRSLLNLLQTPASFFTSGVFLVALAVLIFASALAIFAMIKLFSISMLAQPRSDYHDEQKGNDGFFLFPLASLGLILIVFGASAKSILETIFYRVSQQFFSINNLNFPISISSLKVIGIFLFFIAITLALYKLFTRNIKPYRKYNTWDCGQPINASMSYTSTAFSAPIRFFFLPFLQRSKEIVSIPVNQNNPWIAKKYFSLNIISALQDRIYKPLTDFVYWCADKVRLIHTGRIQYYLLMLLATVIITLIIVL